MTAARTRLTEPTQSLEVYVATLEPPLPPRYLRPAARSGV